jgi:predicted negative regulator of RcsB-dependent stress response
LAADRRGDIHLIKGEKEEAKKAYLQAHSKMGDDMEYRRLVEVKLNALGVDLTATSPASK